MATKAKKGQTKKDGHNFGTTLGTVAALAAVGAAGYFLYGPKGAQHRKKVSAWTLKAKAEVLEGLEKLRDVSEAQYHALIEKAVVRYGDKAGATEADVAELAKELKGYWKKIASTGTAKRSGSGKKSGGRKGAHQSRSNTSQS